MLNNAKLTVALCKKLWAKAANTATLLENRLKPSACDSDALSQFCGKGVASAVQHALLHKSGKICITTKHNQLPKGKLSNRGKQRLFLEYSENHVRGTYRDVFFLKKSYGEWALVNSPEIMDVKDEEEENLESEAEGMKDDQQDDETEDRASNYHFGDSTARRAK